MPAGLGVIGISLPVINDLLTGQYDRPLRVVAFDPAEGWSRDASEDLGDRRKMLRAIAAMAGVPAAGAPPAPVTTYVTQEPAA